MFDKHKFKKLYPQLVNIITDKETIKKYINDKSLLDFYNTHAADITKLLSLLSKLYSKEEIKEIILSIIEQQKGHRLSRLIEQYELLIHNTEHYHGDLEPIKKIGLDIVEYSHDIEDLVLKKCFNYDYKEPIEIHKVDIKDIFLSSYTKEKKAIYQLLKKGNLDLLAGMYNEIKDEKINSKEIKEIFEREIDDVLYTKETKEGLGEDLYSKVINCYFISCKSVLTQNIIVSILKNKNYRLLKEFSQACELEKIYDYISISDTDKDIFSLKGHYFDSWLMTRLMSLAISDGHGIKDSYYDKLPAVVSKEELDKFNEEHSEALGILKSISKENIEKMTPEERRKLYEHLKTIGETKKDLITKEIEKINKELVYFYKKYYSEQFDKASSIISKAEERIIKDSKEEKHEVKVYDLKDEEPFTFLITVMHRGARKSSGAGNMYGRPAHKDTIEKPSKFLEDPSNGSKIISTSVINQGHISTYIGTQAELMYIFSDLEPKDIMHISPDDAAHDPEASDIKELFESGRPMDIYDLMLKTGSAKFDYNEIAINRKRNGEKIKPTAILCYNEINDDAIRHAEFFQIPIIVVHTKTYFNLKNVIPEETKKHRY